MLWDLAMMFQASFLSLVNGFTIHVKNVSKACSYLTFEPLHTTLLVRIFR